MRLLNVNVFLLAVLLILGLSWKPDKRKSFTKNWINIEYVKCLKSRLPCECEEMAVPFFLIRLDTNQTSKSFGIRFYGSSNMEFMSKRLKVKSQNTYDVFDNLNDSLHYYGTIVLKDDTLTFFNKNNEKLVFANFGNSLADDEYQYTKENIILLNESFQKRQYESLNKILGQNILYCDCNKELGGVNLVSGGKKSWILEQRNDSLYIFNYLNSLDDKSLPPVIKKKIVKKLRWNLISNPK